MGPLKGAVDDALSSHSHNNTNGENRLNVKTFNRPRCEQLIVSEFWFLLCHTVRLSARRPRQSASTAAQQRTSEVQQRPSGSGPVGRCRSAYPAGRPRGPAARAGSLLLLLSHFDKFPKLLNFYAGQDKVIKQPPNNFER